MWRGGGAGKVCNKTTMKQHCGGSYQYTATAGHWKDPGSYRWGAPSKRNNVFPSLAGATGCGNVFLGFAMPFYTENRTFAKTGSGQT
jgi:hypothetical protein